MNRTWLRRMIWSYLPIFFIMFSFLFFVFFQTLVEQNNRNTKEASKVFVGQLLQTVDVSLKTLDTMMIRELVSSKLLSDFFFADGNENVFLNYQIVNRMQQMQHEMSIIDSYYLVRYKDGIVFSGKTTKMDDFQDIAFIRSQQYSKESHTSTWSSIRSYHELVAQKPKSVISLVHRVSVGSDADGLIVVNVSAASLRTLIKDMYNPEQAFVQLYDRGNQPLFIHDEVNTSGKVLASQTSPYSGWTVESGVVNGKVAGLISNLSSIWLVLGLLIFLAGSVFIVYITRKNYKPIEELVFRIQDQFGSGKPSLGRLAVDEFTFIETAINNFAEQTKLFRKEAEASAISKRKTLFMELLHFEKGMQSEAIDLTALPEHDKQRVLVIEIDQPEQIFNQYISRDQALFKFVISSATHELFTQHGISIWLDWTSTLQMTGLLFLPDSSKEEAEEICERITTWIHQHLAFTVTIGLGEAAAGADLAGVSNKQALEALTFKAALGHNRVIHYSDTQQVATVKTTNTHLQAIHRLIQHFRLHEENWQESFDSMFSGMRSCCLPKSEITELCRYFVAHMDLQLSQASKDYYDVWKSETSGSLREIIEEFDTLDELQSFCRLALQTYADQIGQLYSERMHHQLLQDIRGYIGHHFSNSELSLEYLADKFGISAKYISQLFKEEFGENFLDYLSQLRISEAKKRLLEQANSIQEVGEHVGYVNAATFRRVFRKVEGISPVDFRKRHAM
ncbi:helix-turn-helix domain-containing protein [Paenibacillus albus]|uniref:Helix-turn-helix domain-containing protein n=1 Tax=Paenibacillus albus TaxID=2495582 RepID=A0A3Q8X8N7_9BACL|nr:helix-turn-helix domain-containing protein [Paenibacillus albus]AZN43000.1 helix-turn-helix domain-containing protein [Paenibacillus albus]